MTRDHKRTGPPSLYAAVEQIKERGLRTSDSLFTPGRSVWTADVFNELHRHLIDQPDLGKRPYLDKLSDQMSEASDEALQLMAELHYFHFLIALSITGKKKRETVNAVLSWMSQPASVPGDLDAAMDDGFVNPGQYYLARRDRQISLLIEFGERWKELSGERIEALLADPWEFKAFVHGLQDYSAFTQREALLHLVHPGSFDAIVSRDHKEKIVKRYKSLVQPGTTDVDKQLAEIRVGLTPRMGGDFDFYEDELVAEWQGGSASAQTGSAWDDFVKWAKRFRELPDFAAGEQDYKLSAVTALVEARQRLLDGEDWFPLLKTGFQNPDNNLTPWQAHARFLDWVQANPDVAEAALRGLWAEGDPPAAERITALLDAVPKSELSGSGARLAVASYLLMSMDPAKFAMFRPQPFKRAYELTATPPDPSSASEADRYDKALAFLDQFMAEAASRSLEIEDRLEAQGLVWCVTKWGPPDAWSSTDRASFLTWRGQEVTETSTLDELARSLYMEPSFLTNASLLLEQKRQVIFHGPPGTGKTYIAQRLAEHLAGSEGSVDIVQFHPSYAYEDFVEGFRPDPNGTGFVLREGPLKRAVSRALESPNGTHILLIDEINRGNIAKVFGELYFLLEYRDTDLTLQYSDEPFRLPRNLWFIGTMNTADRSIAIVDGALRRRFYFVGFFPEEPPVAGLLGRWLGAHKPELAWVADVVDRANERLGDRHASIGPSHFMREDLTSEWVELIWHHSVLPYVAEQLFGEQHRISEFSLHALRSPTPAVAAPDDADAL